MQPYHGLRFSDNTPKIFSVKEVLLDAQTERNLDLTARLQVERCLHLPSSIFNITRRARVLSASQCCRRSGTGGRGLQPRGAGGDEQRPATTPDRASRNQVLCFKGRGRDGVKLAVPHRFPEQWGYLCGDSLHLLSLPWTCGYPSLFAHGPPRAPAGSAGAARGWRCSCHNQRSIWPHTHGICAALPTTGPGSSLNPATPHSLLGWFHNQEQGNACSFCLLMGIRTSADRFNELINDLENLIRKEVILASWENRFFKVKN